jgi:hypothetical protein
MRVSEFVSRRSVFARLFACLAPLGLSSGLLACGSKEPVCHGDFADAGLSGSVSAKANGIPLSLLPYGFGAYVNPKTTVWSGFSFVLVGSVEADGGVQTGLWIDCQGSGAPWPSGPHTLAELCAPVTLKIVSDALHSHDDAWDLTSVPSTVVTNSMRDNNGDGTVTVRLDIPQQTLDYQADTVDFAVSALVGTGTTQAGPCFP